MEDRHPHQVKLLKLLLQEMKGQEKIYSLGPESSLKHLKSIGVVLHPISVTRKKFGYAEYPEISFKLPFALEAALFRDNSAIECFIEGEESVKGVFLGMNGRKGDFRLYTPDFPHWVEDEGVGLKLAPDHRTFERMQGAIKKLDEKSSTQAVFKQIHGKEDFDDSVSVSQAIKFHNQSLNESQQEAVSKMTEGKGLSVLHGPPGTGKTTTLIEIIVQKIERGDRILVTAPSNAAVDHIAGELVSVGLNILRVGNTLKVNKDIYAHTPEGRLINAKEFKEIKKLKIRSEELRKMSYQYKRNFGKAEREQRSLLIRESKSIRKEIRAIKNYFDEKLVKKADVIIGTPIGLDGFLPEDALFDALLFDESGQAIEPLAWVVFPYANSWILAGDPFQLPPTVISQDASNNGLNISILEHAFKKCKSISFLDTQYRMLKNIAEFSNREFYENKLKSAAGLESAGNEVIFIDTAGTEFEESHGKNGMSLQNEGELITLRSLIQAEKIDLKKAVLISPYAGQTQLAKELLPDKLQVSTIDSFQGQEKEIVLVSLVRSNSEGIIGFLKDYRRMNVALTRAKSRLIVIGDSSTIGHDSFYASFLSYIEEIDAYRSAWEFMK